MTPKCSSLQQKALRISQSLWVRDSGIAEQGVSGSESYKAEIKVWLAGCVVPPEVLSGGESASKLTQAVAGRMEFLKPCDMGPSPW